MNEPGKYRRWHPDHELTPEQRFWRYVDRRSPDECWPWMAGRTSSDGNGYGVSYAFSRGAGKRGRENHAHRIALSLNLGRPITPGAHVLHSCDNKWCCNPAHLREGTHAENMRDNKIRGLAYRHTEAVTHCKHGHEFTTENTLWSERKFEHETYRVRKCRECNRIYLRNRRERHRLENAK